MNTQKVLVVDIGSFQIKAYYVRLTEGRIVIEKKQFAESQGFSEGKIQDGQLLGKAINNAVGSMELANMDAIDFVMVGIGGMELSAHFAFGSLALPGSHVQREDIQHVNDATVLSTVIENAEILHMIPKNYRLDGCFCEQIPVGKSGTRLECECSVITINKQEIEKLSIALEIANIKPNHVMSNIFAMYEIIQKQLKEQSYVLLNIGAENMEAIVCEDGKFISIFSVPIGGEAITKSIMDEVNLDYAHAEVLKRIFSTWNPEDFKEKNKIIDCSDENIQDKNVQYDLLYDIICNKVNEITDIIYEKLSLELIDRDIINIYFMGGSSSLYNFRESLEKRFAMNVKTIDQLNMRTANIEDFAGYSLIYASENFIKKSCEQNILKSDDEKNHSFLGKIKKLLNL